MEHNLFKPSSFEEGKHAVVGDCNGFTMQQRWDAETPEFAKAILHHYFKKQTGESKIHPVVLDYGCGVGRLAKEILNQSPYALVTGVDASNDMMLEAEKYVENERFNTCDPVNLTDKYDIIYCVYVLQHCPAIELREVLARIHHHLKDDGIFVYCSSDYRMCIRFDGKGFFDDRFLGVNLQEEIGRLFNYQEELFDRKTLDNNQILATMIETGLQHPAKVYTKKQIADYLHIAKKEEVIVNENTVQEVEAVNTTLHTTNNEVQKLLLVNRLAPGDILVMTNAIRDLATQHKNKYLIDVRTPCNEIFDNNPYITKLSYNESEFNKINSDFSSGKKKKSAMMGDILVIDMQYPLIHRSGVTGAHFAEGHREYLEEVLNIKINRTELTPEIYLSASERDWINPVTLKTGHHGKYWVINAGSKGDFTLKQYPYYQEVVNLLKDKITLVQIGQMQHNHPALDGTIDLRGKTNVRELFRAIYHAEGVITCVSFPMHIAASFKKPCVVVAGAREGTRWELYPNHQFLYVNGCLPCATYDGCWKSKQEDCINKVIDEAGDSTARCMTLIQPNDVMRAVQRYYDGGMLSY